MAEETCDVVIIGSGAAGLFCAVAAQALGLRCTVLEKAAQFGGGTAGSAGLLWVGANHLIAADGGSDSAQDVIDYLHYVGSGGLDEAKMHRFVREAPGALQFFAQQGLPFRLTKFVDHYYGVAPGGKLEGRIVELPPISGRLLGSLGDAVALPAGPLYRLAGSESFALGGANNPRTWDAAARRERDDPDLRGAGAGLVTWLLKLAADGGTVLRTGTAVDRLSSTGGRVTGVVTTDGTRIAARHGVVIACGGYESNPALVDRYEALPGWQSMFPETLTGDGLIMAGEHGAAIDTIANNLSIFLGFRNPDERPGAVAVCRLSGIQELIAPHTMVVNRSGRRFADETFFQAMAPSLRIYDPMARTQPNLPCFLIFDHAYVAAHSFGGRPPGAPIPPWVARATTLAALAAQLGLPAEDVTATARRFSDDVRSGSDTEFHRGETPWGQLRFNAQQTLGTIEQSPFYGIELHPTALASAGLRTDTDGRVIDVRGRRMDGLYAIGNAAARKETGSGYQTGFSLGSAMAFGMIAARSLADKKQGLANKK